jgi:predicted anti-sigma-YlaC factor YlaD
MNQQSGREEMIRCRVARGRLPALLAAEDTRAVFPPHGLSAGERDGVERHLQTCEGCAAEYRLMALSRAVMDAAASPEPIAPDEDFFKAVRARIRRGEVKAAAVDRPDESWAAALLLTARQLIPVMALLLLLIIGATFLWSNASQKGVPSLQGKNALPRLFDDPAPSADDALDSFMAVEEKKNGK